jgi:hypothetical protein
MGNEALVMGDLVLTEDEIEPVMRKLQQNGRPGFGQLSPGRT